MLRSIFPLLLVAAVTVFASHQNYPGTKTRPVLSDSEASGYTKANYFQGWTPGAIQHSTADYTVGSGHYTYIQEAVNAAIKAGGTTRKYIHIEKGTYRQLVLIPKTTVPITIYGTYGAPLDVHIVLSQGANMKGSTWSNQVNPGGKVFKEGDPAYSMYNSCASKTTIGTACSAVLRAQADHLELAYLTIENPSTDGQAVAGSLEGDKQQVFRINFYGFQDTLYLGGQRIYVNRPTIKGDVDFIFGSASAVIDTAQIIARADRPRTSALVFAPNTDQSAKYGFLVIDSGITAENAIKAANGLSLAREWDSSSSVNGQLVIRNTVIDNSINENAPYSTSTGGKPFNGNANRTRNVDDTHFNRFWEYKNTGGGS